MSFLPTYGGYAQENLNAFIDDLNSYFSIKGITDDTRKKGILRAQLRHAAKIYAEDELSGPNAPDLFNDWIDRLMRKFVTRDVLARRQYDFYDIIQGAKESPRDLASRMQEAAHLAAFQQS